MARQDLRSIENVNIIKNMLEQGSSFAKIGEHFQCSANLIRNICIENNIATSKCLRLTPGLIINGYKVLYREMDNIPWKSHETGYWVQCLKCQAKVLMRKSVIPTQSHDCNNERGGRGHYNIVANTKFGYLTTTGNCKTHKTSNNNYHTYVEVKCDCGSDPFFVRKNHLLGKHHSRTISCGCASRSAGEIKLAQLLDACNIPYVEQYNITDLSQWMRFDFAIYANNDDDDDTFLGLIEYDGKQHFESVDKFGGEEKFILQQERDQRKNQYCKENNIFLLRIPYTDFDKLDKEYLFSRFPKLKDNLV